MDKTYKVLKKFGDLKKGSIFDPKDNYDGTEEDIAEAVEAGYIEEVLDGANEPGVEAPKEKKAKKTEVTVTWGQGSRVYSLAVHGENFMDLAESFANKFNGTIV